MAQIDREYQPEYSQYGNHSAPPRQSQYRHRQIARYPDGRHRKPANSEYGLRFTIPQSHFSLIEQGRVSVE